MPFVTRKTLLTLTALSGVAVAAAAGFIWSGFYNMAADDPHYPMTTSLLEAMRERSVETRAGLLTVPDITDPARITQGAGNYNAMCMGCHLAPGMGDTELSRGLYPAPPNLSKVTVDAAEAFWVIKHGIKASGMPAWGRSMGDEYLWNMAAFLQQLPKLSPTEYQVMVASSGGHDHGGGETRPHGHPEGTPADHHGGNAGDAQGSMQAADMQGMHVADTADPSTTEGLLHTHADGTRERHPAPSSAAAPDAAARSPAPIPAEPRAAAAEPPPAQHVDDGHQH